MNISIVEPHLTHLEVMKIDENAKVVIRPYSQPFLASSYRNWNWLFFIAVWAEPKLGFERSASICKVRIYLLYR